MKANCNNYPRWAREIHRFIGIKSQFLLWGNIYDLFPFPINEKSYLLCPLINYISELVVKEDGYEAVVCYDVIDGFELIKGDPEMIKSISGLKLDEGSKQPYIELKKAPEVIEKLATNREHAILTFLNFSSRYTQNPENLSEDQQVPFFTKMLKLSYRIKSHFTKGKELSTTKKLNSVFWFADKINDIPTWLTLNNPGLKTIGIPRPDNETREYIIKQLTNILPDYKLMDSTLQKKLIEIFVDQTEKMTARDLIAIIQFMEKEHLKFSKIAESIKGYKLGIIENRWEKLSKDKLLNGAEILKKRVKGQNPAVIKALDILKRGYIGLSGSQHSKLSGKPKGVLFFAGPTGVGKTELAKAITELIFGNEQNYIRFDMSEFNHEHSDQRFIGAPPGYVGYESGGELTNAVKQNPFSVILFDEIEKAHPRILDKFLQILEDGRLTDGRGETVYFSETLIIFTSNLGVSSIDENGKEFSDISSEIPYENIKNKILIAIEKFFKNEIKRPEILNRLGKNIIVFDYIRAEAAEDIFKKMLENITSKLIEDNKITIKIEEKAYNILLNECTKDLAMGGRGIGNKLEEVFVNPLARTLFDISAKENDNFIIKDIESKDDEWKILVKISEKYISEEVE